VDVHLAADAIRAGDHDALRRLLTQQPGLASAAIGPRSLLHIATDWPGHRPGVAATIAALVAAGADVNVRFAGPEHGETPLHWAASNDDVDAMDALLDAGADIEAAGAVIAGGTALDDAVAFAQWRAAARLVERGAYVNTFNAAALGLTDRIGDDRLDDALWAACHGGQRAAAEMLLERGADPDRPAPWEPLTPADAARRNGFDDLAAWLTGRSGSR
jgi:uncharacterized protein